MSDLTAGTDTSRPRVLFLLTDGRMDVSESPAYGDPRTARPKAHGSWRWR